METAVDKMSPEMAQFYERMNLFVSAINMPAITDDIVAEALKPNIGGPGQEALAILSDKNAVPDADIKEALKALGIPSGKLNMHIQKLRGEVKAEPVSAVNTATGSVLNVLPVLPEESSFLEMLKTGGILKPGKVDVISAIKAGLASKVGLYDLPDKILEKMEEFAEAQEEPVGEAFFKLQKMLTEKRYGDILAALGTSGQYVTVARKKALLEKIDERLWGSLQQFHKLLGEWQQAWMGTMGNPAMLMMALSASQSGGGLPTGMMAPPDTTPLRASAEEVINEINRIFSGVGIPVSRALAFDATRIMGILNDNTLPAQIGATTKDQMLKELGVSVGAEIVRTEQSITRYALAVMELSKVTADNEVTYLAAMFQLGASIPWDKIGVLKRTSRAGIPG